MSLVGQMVEDDLNESEQKYFKNEIVTVSLIPHKKYSSTNTFDHL